MDLKKQDSIPELQSNPEEDASSIRPDHERLSPSIPSLFGFNSDLLDNLAMLRNDECVMNISVRMQTCQDTQSLIFTTFHGEIPRRLRESTAGRDQTLALETVMKVRNSQDEYGQRYSS
jgi:hypothetical protein